MAPRKDQYRAIWSLASRVWGRSESSEQLHALVYREYRRESLRDLTPAQAVELIATLKRVDRNLPTPGANAASRQVKKIAKLGYLLQWSTAGIRGFLLDAVGKRDWNELTPTEADRVIKRMEKILKSKMHAAEASTETEAAADIPEELVVKGGGDEIPF